MKMKTTTRLAPQQTENDYPQHVRDYLAVLGPSYRYDAAANRYYAARRPADDAERDLDDIGTRKNATTAAESSHAKRRKTLKQTRFDGGQIDWLMNRENVGRRQGLLVEPLADEERSNIVDVYVNGGMTQLERVICRYSSLDVVPFLAFLCPQQRCVMMQPRRGGAFLPYGSPLFSNQGVMSGGYACFGAIDNPKTGCVFRLDNRTYVEQHSMWNLRRLRGVPTSISVAENHVFVTSSAGLEMLSDELTHHTLVQDPFKDAVCSTTLEHRSGICAVGTRSGRVMVYDARAARHVCRFNSPHHGLLTFLAPATSEGKGLVVQREKDLFLLDLRCYPRPNSSSGHHAVDVEPRIVGTYGRSWSRRCRPAMNEGRLAFFDVEDGRSRLRVFNASTLRALPELSDGQEGRAKDPQALSLERGLWKGLARWNGKHISENPARVVVGDVPASQVVANPPRDDDLDVFYVDAAGDSPSQMRGFVERLYV